jgi:glutamate N-acetyltransferase/amino-acid N-acetyltransferase
MKTIKGGSVTTPAGFLASGIACGIKESGLPDLGLVLSERPATLAAVFTTNLVKAAPVLRGMRLARRGVCRAFIANSGCANACTGPGGLRDADLTADIVARPLGIGAEEVLTASTGKIGMHLDLAKIRRAIPRLVGSLSPDGGGRFAKAILTTDTVPKSVAVKIELSGGTILIGGCAKGAGMISPGMATLLAFLTTDASVKKSLLKHMLKDAAGNSFNRITIDGHMSTNDTAAMMANGASGVSVVSKRDAVIFEEALAFLCSTMAKKMVRYGEGATKLVEIEVTGARSDANAEDMARRIADSALVKCALHGADPNWGRIVSAAGYAGAKFKPENVKLKIGTILVFRNGVPAPFSHTKAVKYMRGDDIAIHLSVGKGKGKAIIHTCDLSKEYVSINAEYTT